MYSSDNGAIATNIVTLQSSSFESNPPTFTLVGDTSGGPPTISIWRRNGEELSDSNSYSISIEANPNDDQDGRVNARYRSTLVVTGMLPGVYEYQVGNKATSGDVRDSLNIEGKASQVHTIHELSAKPGGDPTNLVLALSGNSTVRVSWTAPEGPPITGGYRIVDDGHGLNWTAPSSPQELMLTPGDYNIQVMYTSQHFPGGMVGPQAITVLGMGWTYYSLQWNL